jgi:outer membrane lipoprotein-sorting protein
MSRVGTVRGSLFADDAQVEYSALYVYGSRHIHFAVAEKVFRAYGGNTEKKYREEGFMKRNRVRWIPSIVAPALVAASMVVSTVSANANVALPEKTASQILQFINTDENLAFSGSVTKVANLGLPSVGIPQSMVQGNIATMLGLLGGIQKANLYYNGPKSVRVQMLDDMSERDFIVNGQNVWFYDATKQTAQHFAMKVTHKTQEAQSHEMWNEKSTKLPFDVTSPAAIADYFLSQIDPSTTVTTGQNILVAGRGSYELILTPKSTGTLIASVTISVDGKTGLPLAVAVYAVGQNSPAFSVSFDSVSFSTPAASLFGFTPPTGVAVKELSQPADRKQASDADHAPTAAEQATQQAEMERLKAEGWAAIVRMPASKASSKQLDSLRSNPYFSQLTSAVSGGRIFSTALFNVLITTDGRVFAGAVTKQKLLEAAAR